MFEQADLLRTVSLELCATSLTMLLVQERIIGNLDRVQDVLMLGMVSRAALSAVQQAIWAGVHRLRLTAVHLKATPSGTYRNGKLLSMCRDCDRVWVL